MANTKLTFTGDLCRLDVFLAESELGISRPFAQRIISQNLVTVNGNMKKPGYILKENDIVEVNLPDAEGKAKEFEKFVFYEDEWIMAIHKPSGLAVHPNSPLWETNFQACLVGEPTLVSMILQARPNTANSGMTRLGLVHRLDRDTSGLMLIAKDPDIQKELSDGFRDRLMEKTYIGCVSPLPKEENGIIDAPIGRAGGFKKIKVWEFGRDAITCYKVKEKTEKCALLEISPQTGRTNQIRIHMEYMGSPILGDKLYHGLPADRMLLHSSNLIFKHPATGKETSLRCPLPEDFKSAWIKAKKEIK